MYERWLAAFHAVARFGGFTAAAGRLNVGQPTVSMHVRALEDRFGVELFHRRGRTVELTEIGKTLLSITQGLFGHEEEAIKLLHAAHALEIGALRIGALRTFDVMEVGAAFLQEHPRVKLVVTIQTSPLTLDGLLKFDLDVGVVGHAPSDQRFFSFHYNRYRILVVVNADHPLANRRAIHIEELNGQKIILRDEGSTTRAAFERALDQAGVKVQPVLETNNRDAVRAAVLRGIGIGTLSESEIVGHPRLKALPVTNANMFSHSYVVCLAQRRDRPLIANFLRLAKSNARRFRKTNN